MSSRDQSWDITSRYLYGIQNQENKSGFSVTTSTCKGIAINKFAL